MSGPYSIETDIVNRLAEQLPPAVRAASGAALSAQAKSVGELAPIVVIEPTETEVSDSSQNARHIIEDQEWVAAVVVRHTADPETLTCDYTELDAVIIATIGALTGWKPSAGTRELRYAARGDILHEPGLLEVRLSFTTFYHISITT